MTVTIINFYVLVLLYIAIYCNIVHRTVQHSTVQYSTVLYFITSWHILLIHNFEANIELSTTFIHYIFVFWIRNFRIFLVYIFTVIFPLLQIDTDIDISFIVCVCVYIYVIDFLAIVLSYENIRIDIVDIVIVLLQFLSSLS